jgi:hypothetical protein
VLFRSEKGEKIGNAQSKVGKCGVFGSSGKRAIAPAQLGVPLSEEEGVRTELSPEDEFQVIS